MDFRLISKFKPTGDQPQAIGKLVKNLKAGVKNQVLLGITGCGKTFDICNIIKRIQKPVLLISHNKKHKITPIKDKYKYRGYRL